MSADEATGRFDVIKWCAVFALIAISIVGNSYYSDQSLLYRVLAIVLLGFIAILLSISTEKGSAAWSLIKDSRTEIRKVVWPTRQETVQTTFIVVVFVLLVALVLWALDSFFGWLASLAIG